MHGQDANHHRACATWRSVSLDSHRSPSSALHQSLRRPLPGPAARSPHCGTPVRNPKPEIQHWSLQDPHKEYQRQTVRWTQHWGCISSHESSFWRFSFWHGTGLLWRRGLQWERRDITGTGSVWGAGLNTAMPSEMTECQQNVITAKMRQNRAKIRIDLTLNITRNVQHKRKQF